MKWFKHMTDASTDLFVQDLEERFGDTGYVFWFKTLELLGSQGRDGEMEISVNVWRQIIDSGRTDHLRRLYTFATQRRKLEVEDLGNGLLRVRCEKFLEFADEYASRIRKNRDKIPTQSGECSPRTEGEEEQKEKKKKSARTALPIEVVIPENLRSTIGFEVAWEEWRRFRQYEKKKPLTESMMKKQLEWLAGQINPVGIIAKSIRNGWQGLFPLKEEYGKGNAGTHRQNGREVFDESTLKRLLERTYPATGTGSRSGDIQDHPGGGSDKTVKPAPDGSTAGGSDASPPRHRSPDRGDSKDRS